MKIENSGKPFNSASTSSAARSKPANTPASAANTAPSSAAAGTTQASLSGLQGVASVLASAPVADTARVAEIKQAISEGRFQVNPERIADGLLNSVREMLGSHR